MDYQNCLFFVLLLLVGVIIWNVVRLRSVKKEREQFAKENKRLIHQNMLLEAEHLKFQLQPHTLNNILSNLRAISNKLNKGIESFSETLEYILYKGNTHFVSIEDELIFIRRYLNLNDLFLSEIDSIKYDDSLVNANSKYYRSPCVPHLITAYLIENAFKHGDRDHPEFLQIELTLSESVFEMKVVNRIRPGKVVSENRGIGLSNMRKRLELLIPNKYSIESNCNEFEYCSKFSIRF